MQIITDVSKISKTVQPNLTFILNFILPSFQSLLLKRILAFSHKMIFIENEAALLCATMRELAREFAAFFSFCVAIFDCILSWE